MVEDQHHVGERPPQGHGRLLVRAAPGEAVLAELDEPFGTGGVGGVQMDGAPATAQLRRLRVVSGARGEGDDVQPLVDGVRRQVRGHRVGHLRGQGRVRLVDDGLDRHAPGPESGAVLPGPGPDRQLRPRLPQYSGGPRRPLGQPGVQHRGVVAVRREVRHPLLRDLLRGPGAHDLTGPALGAADVDGEIAQRPFGTGRYPRVEVAVGHRVPQRVGSQNDFVAVALMRERGHARSLRAAAAPDPAVIRRAARWTGPCPSPRRPRSSRRP